MKRRTVAAVVAFLLVAGAWWGLRDIIYLYPPDEVASASDLIQRYYAHLLAGEYRQALGLVVTPTEQVRDWSYEQEWRARYLQRLGESGEYRMLTADETTLVGGPPDNRPKRMPLTFSASMIIEQNGQKDIVAENLYVAKVDGQFRIVDFLSTDHYIRYRAYAFQLQRVGNPQ